MSDARTLLSRITSFRQRLEQMPHLIPVGVPVEEPDEARTKTAVALAENPDWLSQSIRSLAGATVTEGPLPPQLTVRARRLLEDARGLIAVQRQINEDPLVAGLGTVGTADQGDPIVQFHRDTVAFTDAALRMVQAFPGAAEVQLKMCGGVEVMLRTVRDRLTVAQGAVAARRKLVDRIDGLARRLTHLASGRAVDLSWFKELAESVLDDARQAGPVRFLSVDPRSTVSYPGGPAVPTPARYVAAHALTVAQIVARIVPQDYEWASRPVVPVLAALLMDVGMLRVPVDILAKPETLTADERGVVEAHAAAGGDLIRNLFPDAGPIADAIAAHHERPDGTGYPNALTAEEIPTLARLLSVCDAYAAMASDRPHRPTRDPRTALTDALMAAEQGRLDRDFSEYLLQLSFHPIGTVVELTDGRVGVVVANHTSRVNLRATARPVVAVLTDSAQNVLPRPEFVDLAAAEVGGVSRVLNGAERSALLARHYPELCA
ncbi:HD-GYP domain-containing protein [Fimbriiglobus ruber]|uniref:GAF domain/HD domain protein n=1 Tax=Fimbriiglobus ruber TaxID=1908690 RepID=A0A225E0D7_9BACT|nr:HD domain-containing phosphohydrolase [Fimbriiglobus ruber]OWK47032.1 GAF domain/HD domain protein [Fimbriiglobus ruber]